MTVEHDPGVSLKPSNEKYKVTHMTLRSLNEISLGFSFSAAPNNPMLLVTKLGHSVLRFSMMIMIIMRAIVLVAL